MVICFFYVIRYFTAFSKGDELANRLTPRVRLTQEQANIAITIVTKTLVQKAESNKTSNLLSKLPGGIARMFSDHEKQQFTSTPQNVSNEEVIQRVRSEAGIPDENKARQTTEEELKLLQEKTGEQGL